jgi:DNA-binding CsgD family transcriptional regulator/tetratricopeptide (TPR) repeat protein
VVDARRRSPRRAIVDDLAPSQRVRHHRTMLDGLLAHRPDETARILHHAAGADAAEVIAELAPRAAQEAFAAGAHRQAAIYEELALRHDDRLDVATRAAMWEQHAWSLHFLSRGRPAAEAAGAALSLREEMGDPAGLVRALTTRATMRFMSTDAAGGAADFQRAGELIGNVDDEQVRAEFDVLQLTVRHLRGEHASVLATGDAVLAASDAADRPDLRLLARTYLCGSQIVAGETAGLDELAAVLRSADRRVPADTRARAHLRLGLYLVYVRRWEQAEEQLGRAIDYFDDHGFGFHRHMALGLLAYVHVERCAWDGAQRMLDRLSADAQDAGIAHAVPLHAAAVLAMRTGSDRAEALVRDAWELGANSHTAEYLVRAATAMLEWAWLTDQPAIVDEVAGPALEASEGTIFHGPVLWYLGLNGRDASVPTDLPGPEGPALAGDHEAAANGWGELGMPFQQAVERLRSEDVELARQGLEDLIGLGARGAIPLGRRRLRDLGVRHVPYGPQGRTRANPAGLTPRQLDVLELLAQGLTNAAIADRLVLSIRTVDHHVSAILRKLDVPRRGDAAAKVAELELRPEPS